MLELDPSEAPAPVAKGVLSEKPLTQLLAYAVDRKMSGTFWLEDPAALHGVWIVVDQGMLARVWTSEPVSYLGHVLYEAGAVSEGQLGASLAEVARDRSLHGQVLLAHGMIDAAQLANGLRQQRLRKLHHAFSFPGTSSFAFYADADLVGSRPHDVEPTDLLPAIWRGVAAHPSWEHVRAAVSMVNGRALRLVGSPDLSAFQDHESVAVESLRHRPASVIELSRHVGVGTQQAELLTYFLVLTRLVEVTAAAVATSVPPAPVSTRSVAISAKGDGALLARKNSFSMQAPPSSSSTAERTSAPPPSLAEWIGAPPSSGSLSGPPSSNRAPTSSVGPPSSPLESLFPPHLSELSSSPSLEDGPPSSVRAAERFTSARPSATPAAPPQPNPEADRAIEQAEMHFMINERHQALTFVREALTLVPKMPAGLALLAALEASNVRVGQDDKVQEILRRLDAILKSNPTCRRGHLYRGRLRKRLGDLEGALEDFRKAVAHDPEDVDAQRELKLCEAKGREPVASKSVSFLDRLRGR